MEYRALGRTGVQVSALCLGCMNWGDTNSGTSEEESIRIMHRAMDAGINFFDTADVYGRGASETITGKALAADGRRDRVFLATKVYNRMDDADPNAWGSHRYHIVKACEDSLRRLGTDHIDLYQMHRPKSSIPIDETLRALDDLVRQGKVRYIGTSTFGAWQLMEAAWAAKELGLNRFVCEQPPYNLLDRRVERELLPFCRTYGVAVIPWAPIAGGLLSGKYRLGKPRPSGARYEKGAFANRDNDRALGLIEPYLEFCAARDVAPAEMALAWCLSREGVTSPIVGPRTMEQLEAYLKALAIEVTADDTARLDAIFEPGTHASNYYQADFGPNARWM
ncbi:MAG TPA: aldo/keto reductase [Chthonomonadaceae bacterium]|nr:aldo/keto reductase [Chthonomonadaceae bacterium]